MADLEKLTHDILNDTYLATLAVSDADGPWAASVIFVPDKDRNIYWVSKTDSRHSRAIEESGNAACMIIAAEEVDHERALQISGAAERVDTVPAEVEEAHATKRGQPLPSALKEGRSWYKLVPSRIELIHNELFGWDRQRAL